MGRASCEWRARDKERRFDFVRWDGKAADARVVGSTVSKCRWMLSHANIHQHSLVSCFDKKMLCRSSSKQYISLTYFRAVLLETLPPSPFWNIIYPGEYAINSVRINGKHFGTVSQLFGFTQILSESPARAELWQLK